MMCDNCNCKYKDRTCLDEDLRNCCKIYIQYKYKQDMLKESRAELDRMHQENDVGLVRFVKESWHEGKVV
jgi:hypothetical protein